jgi:hypothetical protein
MAERPTAAVECAAAATRQKATPWRARSNTTSDLTIGGPSERQPSSQHAESLYTAQTMRRMPGPRHSRIACLQHLSPPVRPSGPRPTSCYTAIRPTSPLIQLTMQQLTRTHHSTAEPGCTLTLGLRPWQRAERARAFGALRLLTAGGSHSVLTAMQDTGGHAARLRQQH